jgi:hypothetical protein
MRARRQVKNTTLLFALLLALLSGLLPLAASAQAASSPAWRVVSTKPITAPQGFLSRVSCWAPNQCLAIGDDNQSSSNVLVAKVLSGTTWSSIPNVAGFSVDAVSCPKQNLCMAAIYLGNGGDKAELWNGTSWRELPFTDLGSVSLSCPTASFCMAVGVDSNYKPAAARWNGTAWSAQDLSVPATTLNIAPLGVSCPTATFCMAVSSLYFVIRYGEPIEARSTVWDGTTWKWPAGILPGSLGPIDAADVSCSSATQCAVVAAKSHSGIQDFWDGSRWTTRVTATPFNRISCSQGGCAAIATNAPSTTGILAGNPILVGSQAEWQQQRLPLPTGGRSASLADVSCPAAGACVVVGQVMTSQIARNEASYQQQSKGWLGEVIPTPSIDLGGELTTVSCPAAAACTAIASVGPEILEGDSSSGWRTTVPPAPLDSVEALSCPAKGACMVLGPKGKSLVFATQTATGWASRTVSFPTGDNSGFVDKLACFSTSSCLAFGSFVGPKDSGIERVMIWDGQHWSYENTPPGLYGPGDVACPTANRCYVTGGSGTDAGSVLRLNGAWVASDIPLDHAEAISCLTSTSCVAVEGPVFGRVSAVASWNGTTWTKRSTSTPANVNVHPESAFSCSSSTCYADGDSQLVSLSSGGTQWTPVPLPVANPYLEAISCSASTCTAVGRTGYIGAYSQLVLRTP